VDVAAFIGSGLVASDITGKTLVTGVATDVVLIVDATDGALKKVDVGDFLAAGGGDALTSNGLDQFAATTSLELAGVISDETGSGLLVFGTSPTLTTPTLTTPNLGTPSAGVLTNATGLLTAGLVDGAVTLAKMADMATDSFLGRDTASSGVAEVLGWRQARRMTSPYGAVSSTANATAWDVTDALYFEDTLTENTTVAASTTTPTKGDIAVFLFTQATGPYTVAWNAEFDPGTASGTWSGTIPAVSTTSGDVDAFLWLYDGTNFQLWAHVTN